ncbi:MAG TPA: hypothetical protein VEA16_14910, partial [Vicinamibacterales bacterium]|nr:hypothetical protein [Vicinamibacterales bacterium]
MVIKTLVSAVLVVTAGLLFGTAGSTPLLPFYDSSDLTPRWRDVDHRIADFELVTQTGAPLRRADLLG